MSWNRSGCGPVILRAAFLPEGFQDGLHGGGAFGGEVAGDPAGVVEGGVEPQVPLPVPPVIVVGAGVVVGATGPPRLVGGLRDDLQVIQVRAGGGGVEEDPVGLLAQVPGGEPPGPGGDLPGPGPRKRHPKGVVQDGHSGRHAR